MTKSQEIEQTNTLVLKLFTVTNCISEAEGIWVKDPEGNRYLDMLSAYSAVSKVIVILKSYKH